MSFRRSLDCMLFRVMVLFSAKSVWVMETDNDRHMRDIMGTSVDVGGSGTVRWVNERVIKL